MCGGMGYQKSSQCVVYCIGVSKRHEHCGLRAVGCGLWVASSSSEGGECVLQGECV